MQKKNYNVGIIGLGYVGTPLLHDIKKSGIKVVGYDVSTFRINFLKKKNNFLKKIIFNKSSALKKCNVYIICVPTPVKNKNKPDLKYLKKACLIVSKYIKNKDIVIFESTVYPGITRDYCLPLLKKNNEKKDFNIGYAPERISPGDNKENVNIVKIVAGENKKIGKKIKKFYENFIKKVYLTASIEIAELAKNFENCQRDLNIALMNNLYVLCEKAKINPYNVIKACKTKWNFLNFYPGLVGGHCISVDPYYLLEFAKKKKFNIKTIKTSREVNEQFIFDIQRKIKNFLATKNIRKNENILFIGGSYKKNIDDFRNSGALKIYKNISKYYKKSFLYDPYIVKNINKLKKNYKVVVILVFHDEIKKNKKLINIIKDSEYLLDIFQNLKI